MGTTYRLSWRDPDQKRKQAARWRKRYRGKDYYFAINDGETKESSYRRCWAEWLRKKQAIDVGAEESKPYAVGLRKLISRAQDQMAVLAREDTPANRERWRTLAGQVSMYREWLDFGQSPIDGLDPENPQDFWSLGPHDEHLTQEEYERLQPPPWEKNPQTIEPELTLEGNVKRFLQRKESQAAKGQRSHGHYDQLRVGLTAFVAFHGAKRSIVSISEGVLTAYRDHVETLVDRNEIRPHTGRHRLAAVKQFLRWAYRQKILDTLPRVLESREDFSIVVPPPSIVVNTDVEIRRMLASASPTTKLYLLLMLNCGMTQQDISDLHPDEVDWSEGRITRKRSKTRHESNGKNNNVPAVSYRLWPETFRLLQQHRSEDQKRVLVNQKGKSLKVERLENGRVKKIDNIRTAYNRLIRKLANHKTSPLKIAKPLKTLRKTAASKLGSHADYSRFSQHFLGHAPGTVADRHYVIPSQERFDEAVAWLGQQFVL